jgi:type I restriction enzyme, S subunit
MKKYDNYKDSGMEWIGEIPEHWDFKRIGSNCLLTVPQRDKPKDLNGEIPWLRIEDFEGKYISESKSGQGVSIETINEMNLKVYPVGTVLTACSCTMGKTAIVTKPLITNQTFIGITPNENLYSDFLYYFLISSTQYLNSISTGAIQSYLSRDEFSKIKIPFPILEVQTTIANYLDHKTTQIDTLISKKQQFITLLQEERIAVINQAVTKGLDLKVKMKDSGIEWLGEIPEHWDVKKLKFLLNKNKDALKTGPFGSHIKNSDYIPNGEFKVYTQRNVLDNEYENGCESITEEKFSELKGFSVFEGDILITTRGSIGRCSVFPKGLPLGILHPCLIRIQVNEKLSLKNWVVNYINNTSLFYNNVKYNSNSTIIDVIYGYTLKEIFFPVPTINEQREILDFLEIKIDEIETLISKSQQEIELLKEYKTAMISEVVTGKVDVREEILN